MFRCASRLFSVPNFATRKWTAASCGATFVFTATGVVFAAPAPPPFDYAGVRKAFEGRQGSGPLMPSPEMPSRPQHDWDCYLRFISLFLLGHVVAYLALGGVSPRWAILSAGAFGLALGVPIGRAEYYTDGYEIMELICPVFTCGVGLLLGFIAVAGAAAFTRPVEM